MSAVGKMEKAKNERLFLSEIVSGSSLLKLLLPIFSWHWSLQIIPKWISGSFVSSNDFLGGSHVVLDGFQVHCTIGLPAILLQQALRVNLGAR